MLSRLQGFFASLCALGIVLPMSFNSRTDTYAFIWQSDDGPHFLFWLIPLATLAAGRVAGAPWSRTIAAVLQTVLGLGSALVMGSLSSFSPSLFFSEIAWGGWLAMGAAIAFAGVSATRAVMEIRVPKQTLAFSL